MAGQRELERLFHERSIPQFPAHNVKRPPELKKEEEKRHPSHQHFAGRCDKPVSHRERENAIIRPRHSEVLRVAGRFTHDHDLVLPQESAIREVNHTQTSLLGEVRRQQSDVLRPVPMVAPPTVPAHEESKRKPAVCLPSKKLESEEPRGSSSSEASPQHQPQREATVCAGLPPQPDSDTHLIPAAVPVSVPKPPEVAAAIPPAEEEAHAIPAVPEPVAARPIDLSNPENVNVDEMTYEQLLELEEAIGRVSKGLNSEQINVRQGVTMYR